MSIAVDTDMAVKTAAVRILYQAAARHAGVERRAEDARRRGSLGNRLQLCRLKLGEWVLKKGFRLDGLHDDLSGTTA